ncbi:hypothetical protein [Ignatzschineria sp. LJL83]
MTAGSEKANELKDDYDNSTQVREWLGLVSDQLSLIRKGLHDRMSHEEIGGGVELLRLAVDGFYSNSVERVEEVSSRLVANGLGEYTRGGHGC